MWSEKKNVFEIFNGQRIFELMSSFIIMSNMSLFVQTLYAENRGIMTPTLSSLLAPEVVVTTTSGVASDDEVGLMFSKKISLLQIMFTFTIDLDLMLWDYSMNLHHHPVYHRPRWHLQQPPRRHKTPVHHRRTSFDSGCPAPRAPHAPPMAT